MININDYSYPLPADRIAQHPLKERDGARLLVYHHGNITHHQFREISDLLPPNAFLFFNDTRVIPARLHFVKETAATIEIFLLSPVEPSPVMAVAMQAKGRCIWKCTIGNLKRWPTGSQLVKQAQDTSLIATLVSKEDQLVEFTWSGDLPFAEIIAHSGETPLPPYLKRQAGHSDKERYQTIYSHYDGAVAAPTAGLHFTPHVFSRFKERNIEHDFVTLHVSAGTFRPVRTEDADQHTMHAEQVIVTARNISHLLQPNRFVIPVGTTSMRTLESLYWYGVKLLEHGHQSFIIEQDDPYIKESNVPAMDSLRAVMDYMDRSGQDRLIGRTSIFIKPGYRFRVCHGLITNFHQPASTLILLVAAFIGEDWKKIYSEALANDYRFLSYGDSSLLLP